LFFIDIGVFIDISVALVQFDLKRESRGLAAIKRVAAIIHGLSLSRAWR